jgi:hypothetical protein
MHNDFALSESIFKRKQYSTVENPNTDRRSGDDRRKTIDVDYFSNGGLDRRSWRERRKLWYMTM